VHRHAGRALHERLDDQRGDLPGAFGEQAAYASARCATSAAVSPGCAPRASGEATTCALRISGSYAS
jgi:hypothetical protein